MMPPHPLERPERVRESDDEYQRRCDELERASFDRSLSADELHAWLLVLGARM